ncbi:hypothetical protein GCM10011579_032720 [Streptomyces albiflavescens]|uniref:Uncharacterized protein n=1 Tax=Streptomyces albiflavescens TaxID=1623582 RepID=A0A918D3Z7_9ACTN|nr:hypothetical protein GCM10011579_032720 [Streptomyces albiflavescens]
MVPGVQQPLAAAHHAHDTHPTVRLRHLKPVLKDVQAAGLGEPLLPCAVAARGTLAALLADRERQAMTSKVAERIGGLGSLGRLAVACLLPWDSRRDRKRAGKIPRKKPGTAGIDRLWSARPWER